jgi:hypothetical protein
LEQSVSKDFVTRQFIELAKKLRKDFRKALSLFGGDLREIKISIQSIDKNTYAYQTKEPPKPELAAVLHGAEGADKERRGTRRRDRIRLLVEWLTLLAVAGYGLVAYFQLQAMIRATNASERAATAAEGGLTTTRTALNVGERAYVADKGLKIVHPVAAGSQPTIVVDIFNGGRTPALNVTTAITLTVSDHELKTFKWASDVGGSKSTLLPGADTLSNEIATKRALIPDEVNALDSGKVWLYLYGVIRYDDVFGQHWESKFCYFYVPKTESVFSNCPFGNAIK